MSHLDTSYKLGSVQAFSDFESWLQDSQEHEDRPTEAPPKMAAALAVKKALANLEKLGEPRGQKVRAGSRKGGANQPASRAPAGKGSRFSALKAKLSKQKGVSNPGALAAAIGRSKFGKKKFQSMSKKGEYELSDRANRSNQPRAKDLILGRGPEKRQARDVLRNKLREGCATGKAKDDALKNVLKNLKK